MAGERTTGGLALAAGVAAVLLALVGTTVPELRDCTHAYCVEPTWADARPTRSPTSSPVFAHLDLTEPRQWLDHRAELSPFPETGFTGEEIRAFEAARGQLGRQLRDGFELRAWWAGWAVWMASSALLLAALTLHLVLRRRRRSVEQEFCFTARPTVDVLRWGTVFVTVLTLGEAAELLVLETHEAPQVSCMSTNCLVPGWRTEPWRAGRPKVGPDAELRSAAWWLANRPIVYPMAEDRLSTGERAAYSRARRIVADRAVETQRLWPFRRVVQLGLVLATVVGLGLSMMGWLLMWRQLRRLPVDRRMGVRDGVLLEDGRPIGLAELNLSALEQRLVDWRTEGLVGDAEGLLAAVRLHRRLMLTDDRVPSDEPVSMDSTSFLFVHPAARRASTVAFRWRRAAAIVGGVSLVVVGLACVSAGEMPTPYGCANGTCVAATPEADRAERVLFAQWRRARWAFVVRVGGYCRQLLPLFSALTVLVGLCALLFHRRTRRLLPVEVRVGQHAIGIRGKVVVFDELDRDRLVRFLDQLRAAGFEGSGEPLPLVDRLMAGVLLQPRDLRAEDAVERLTGTHRSRRRDSVS